MFSTLARAIALASCLIAPAVAHMTIDNPPVLRHKNNPAYAGSSLIDYSITNPLATSGADFPCKGYHVDIASGVSKVVTTLQAGSSITVTMSGSATHEGGSCQFSVSYDRGKTFGVIQSIIGGCPLSSSYTVPLPSNLPAGKDVLFAWTWFNKIGNREMYMNCMHVNVNSGVSGSITLSKMFQANVMGDQCRTIEGNNVDFANPSVNNCPADKLITLNTKVTLNGNGTPGNSTTGTPTSTSTTPTTTPTNPTGNCAGVAAWVSSTAYTGGAKVTYGGRLWTAKWWTQADTPGGAAGVWTDGGACSAKLASRFFGRQQIEKLD